MVVVGREAQACYWKLNMAKVTGKKFEGTPEFAFFSATYGGFACAQPVVLQRLLLRGTVCRFDVNDRQDVANWCRVW